MAVRKVPHDDYPAIVERARLEPMSLIAAEYGVTRERIRQIVAAHTGTRGNVRLRCAATGCTRFVVERGLCRQHVTRLDARGTLTKYVKYTGPCVDCGSHTPGPGTAKCFTRRRCQRCYRLWRYRCVPGVREMVAERTYAWHKKELAKRGAYYEKFNAYQREYHRKKRQLQRDEAVR